MTVFTRRPAEFTRRPAERANTSRTLNIDVRNQLPGVAAGAAIALLGVLLGSRIARR